MTKLYLISCTNTKADKPCKAKDMYWPSSLFKLSWNYAKDKGKIMILSAEYGLLDPGEVIKPYNKTLCHQPYKFRMQWAQEVHSKLKIILRSFNISEITFLTGRYYIEYLKDLLLEDNYSVHLPLTNMGIGYRMKYLKEAVNGV